MGELLGSSRSAIPSKKPSFRPFGFRRVNFSAIIPISGYCNRCKLGQYCTTLPSLKRPILGDIGYHG